jgi:hypothetical protein
MGREVLQDRSRYTFQMTERYLQRYEGTHAVTKAHRARALEATGAVGPNTNVSKYRAFLAVVSAIGRSAEPEISLSHPQI